MSCMTLNALIETYHHSTTQKTQKLKTQKNRLSCLVGTVLTLKVLVTTIDAQWEGMGDAGSARYEPALLPPCPTIRF